MTSDVTGLGHPAVLGDDDDDDGGFGTVPNDMLTLEEFLNEANKDSGKSGVSSQYYTEVTCIKGHNPLIYQFFKVKESTIYVYQINCFPCFRRLANGCDNF